MLVVVTKTMRPPVTVETVRDQLADLIDQRQLPLPADTNMRGRVLLVRLGDAGDVAPWAATLRAAITPVRGSDGRGGVRWALQLAQSAALAGVWLQVYWEGPWVRPAVSTVDGVDGFQIGGRHVERLNEGIGDAP